MAEYAEISQLPGYVAAQTDHQIALRDAGEDEAAKLRAQLSWSEKTRELEGQMRSHNESERAITQTKAKLKEQYPDVPEAIYSAATSPESMEATAKAFDETVKAQVAAASAPTPPAPGATGQPPTGVGGERPPEGGWTDREDELATKMNEGRATAREAEEYQNIRINMRMLPSVEKARAEARRG